MLKNPISSILIRSLNRMDSEQLSNHLSVYSKTNSMDIKGYWYMHARFTYVILFNAEDQESYRK